MDISSPVTINADNVTIKRSRLQTATSPYLIRVASGVIGTLIEYVEIDNAIVRRNTLQAYVFSSDDSMNTSVQVGSLSGSDQINNFLAEDNYMDGGNYTVNGGGREDTDPSLYRRNEFGRNFVYRVVSGLKSGDMWENTNVWYDTKYPV